MRPKSWGAEAFEVEQEFDGIEGHEREEVTHGKLLELIVEVDSVERQGSVASESSPGPFRECTRP
jgi:hypothetical protein